MTPVQAASIPLFLQMKGDSTIWQFIIDRCAAEMFFGKVRTGGCVAGISIQFQFIVIIEKVKRKKK
jgi:hypothetical protein